MRRGREGLLVSGLLKLIFFSLLIFLILKVMELARDFARGVMDAIWVKAPGGGEVDV